jgi:hypothetical protein
LRVGYTEGLVDEESGGAIARARAEATKHYPVEALARWLELA